MDRNRQTSDGDGDRPLLAAWEGHRRYLLNIAYRLLGSLNEAEAISIEISRRHEMPHVLHRAFATDPVCGMAVDIKRAAHTATYQHRDYYFCCEGCRRQFLDERRPSSMQLI